MRLWSLHPRYLDRQGLTACWREALLAQAVIAGRTRGYTRHPQLQRFLACEDPLAAVGTFLEGVQEEATRRGYRFDTSRIDRPGASVRIDRPGASVRIDRPGASVRIEVSDGQVAFECEHLLAKLRVRSGECVENLAKAVDDGAVQSHPMFDVVPGGIATWERP